MRAMRQWTYTIMDEDFDKLFFCCVLLVVVVVVIEVVVVVVVDSLSNIEKGHRPIK